MWPSSPARTCAVEQPVPHHVGEVRRDMVQRLRRDQRLVRRRQQRKAGSQATAENADPLISLFRQPLHCTARRVEHRLAADLHRPGDVRAHDEVRAVEVRRHPFVVIGQRQTQGAEAGIGEQPAEPGVSVRVGIPLRQDDHRAAGPACRPARRKGPRVDRVVGLVRRLERARKRQRALLAPCGRVRRRER